MTVRQGIPHLYQSVTAKGNKTPALTREQVDKLIAEGRIYIDNMTEKTDGQLFIVGWDKEGFFTQHSGSGDERARTGEDHIKRAERRGNSLTAAKAFAEFHGRLSCNTHFILKLREEYMYSSVAALTGKVLLRGEMFNKQFSRPSDTIEGHIKFIHTSYDPSLLGPLGSFIIHSQMSDLNYFRFLDSSSEVEIDTDIVKNPNSFVDVSDLLDDFEDAKRFWGDEMALNGMMFRIHQRILKYIDVEPLWGQETEGWIIHPSDKNPEAPRFKVITDRFKKAKAENGWKH